MGIWITLEFVSLAFWLASAIMIFLTKKERWLFLMLFFLAAMWTFTIIGTVTAIT